MTTRHARQIERRAAWSLACAAGLVLAACAPAPAAPTAAPVAPPTPAAAAKPTDVPKPAAPTAPAAAAKPTEAPKPAAPAAAASPAAAAKPAGALTRVRMTTFGTCTEMHNWWAQDQGIYAKHGLEVEQVRGVGGSANVAAVVSGAVEFGFVNGFTAINAFATGFPIQLVSSANVTGQPRRALEAGQTPTWEDVSASGMGLWVKTESPIRTAADLTGKKIGVNEVGGLNQIITAAWLKKQGVDPTDVRFVALPFPQQIGAVLSGTIDASQIPIGNVPTASINEVRSIADPFVDLGGKALLAGYVAHRDFVARNPMVAENFRLAIKESLAQIQTSFMPAFDVMANGCKGDVNVLRSQPQNGWEADVDMAMLNQMSQFMVEQGLIGAAPDLNNLVPAFARKA